MTPEKQLKVFEAGRLVFTHVLASTGAIEIGRQRRDDPPPYHIGTAPGGARVVIAALEDTSVSRQHARVAFDAPGAVSLGNTSSNAEVRVQDGPLLGPGQTFTASLPVVFAVGSRVVRIEAATRDDGLASLGRPTMAPGQPVSGPKRFRDLLGSSRDDRQRDELVGWLRATMDVFQSAASSPDFLKRAAQSAASIVGLDVAAVLRWSPDGWRVATAHFATGQANPDSWAPSHRMLERSRIEKSTFRYQPGQSPFGGEATQEDVIAMVAAPILDAEGRVVGALYGEKRGAAEDAEAGPDIPELEAMLVELLASGVAAGLARMEQEKAAVAARVKFEQFFTPELARQLEGDPNLLAGRDAEVTIVFADIRSYSSIAEKIGPTQSLAWTYDVMGTLSDCVLAEDGVLVDYQGDQVMAMWGAPAVQPDHAQRAYRAAVAMLRALPELSQRWEGQIGHATRLGIGVNTGLARVGNVGSRHKFKYGPQGNTVNLASRVQGAARPLGADLLLSETTAAKLPRELPRRRLCEVRVNNISRPVTLYEAPCEATPAWRDLAGRHEAALEDCAAGDLRSAIARLGQLLAEFPDDLPALRLLSRVVDALQSPDPRFDPVWELGSK
ncbi:Adenylate cyclase 2 [Pirellulimonas nuda]|uniref:Adenylate cyclase 2 n=1 Tax=Pirellulimonas nuda TaxID=2528009 RepID=A0A518D951_9BACT|nr:adenylate/guanylate cyclase domain-containing protein [Pirellulimonas nuda]QDU88001.1 Adenylate cyclase 2 [Pirellulimonas nuda]